MADVKEPWEPQLVEELIGVGVENMKLTGGDDDRKKAMENVAEPIANAIKRARTSMKQPTFVAEVLVRQLNSIGVEGLQDYGIYKLTDGGYVMQPGGGDALRVDAGDCVLYIAETKSFVPWVESGGGGAATDFIVEGSQEIAVLKDLSIPGVKRFIVKFSSAFVRALAVLSAHLERMDNPHNVTAEQVGAASAESIAAAIDEHDASDTAHDDIRQDIENEAEARERADTALGERIDDAEEAIENEATARANADTSLGNRIDEEASDRQQADIELQSQIDSITSKSDVVDVVASYAELVAYDTSALGDNDVVKVLEDETHDNAESYYRWNITTHTWGYIGSQGPFVTPAEMQTALNGKVDKVTGKGLSTNDFTDAAKAVTDNIFLATYNSTSYADIKAAYDAGKTILCRFTDSSHTVRVATFDRLINSTTSTSYAYFASVTKADAYELVASKTRYGTTTTWSNTHRTWGSLAEKDGVTNADISGTIQDAHIASAATWNAKQDALSVSDSSAAFSATTTIITTLNNGATLVRNTAGRLWTWIKSQADAIYAPISHSHDDRYYTESEVDSLLAGKQPTITGAATTIATSNLTANRALVSNSSGKVAVSAVTATELGYLDGVTSNVQTQLGNKVDKVSGKGLSTNDFTTDEKNKLAGIAAQVNSDWNATSGKAQILNKPTIPTALSQLSTDSNNQRVSSGEKSTWNGKCDSPQAIPDGVDVLSYIASHLTPQVTEFYRSSETVLSNAPGGAKHFSVSVYLNGISGSSVTRWIAEARVRDQRNIVYISQVGSSGGSPQPWAATDIFDKYAEKVKDACDTSKTISLAWEGTGASVSHIKHIAVFTDSIEGGANQTIRDATDDGVRKFINGSSEGDGLTPVFIDSNGEPTECDYPMYPVRKDQQSSTTNNFNNFNETGYYGLYSSSSSSNNPEPGKVGLFVADANGWLAQICVGDSIHHRTKASSSGSTWTSWLRCVESPTITRIVVGSAGNDPETLYLT